MTRRVKHILVLTVLIAAAALSMPACKRPATKPALPGNPAPAFALMDLDGRKVRLEDYAGKAVILDFWATWCGPCKKATEELEQIHRKYRDRGVVVIGISVDKGGDAATQVKEFAARQGITYLLLLDDDTTKSSYGVTVIPATFVLDRDHIIRDLYPGFRPGIGSEISHTLDKLL
jgi:peroxiredoxin